MCGFKCDLMFLSSKHQSMVCKASGTTKGFRKRLVMAKTSESEFVSKWLEAALGNRRNSSVMKAIFDSTESQILDTQLLLKKLMSLSAPQVEEQKHVSG